MLSLLISSLRLHSSILIALFVAVIVYIYTDRTSAGYKLIATGANPQAARVYGINVRWLFLLSLILGGAIAGLSGGK